MESKALKKIGILRPKRTVGGILRRAFSRLVLFGVIVACGWGGFRYLCKRGDGGSAPAVVAKDDGSLHICEHLSVRQIAKVDGSTRQVGGRMVATERHYWYRLSIDERWYLKKFVPSVKKYLAEIAPTAATETITLDTGSLAYANDGADRLQKQARGRVQESDSYQWPAGTMSARARRFADDAPSRRHERPVLVIGETKDKGAATMATLYKLDKAQFEKFESWIEREVLRDRPNILAVATSAGKEVAAGRWSGKGISPIASVNFQGSSCYAISPWTSVATGRRCQFLGVHCMDSGGLSDAIEIEWTL